MASSINSQHLQTTRSICQQSWRTALSSPAVAITSIYPWLVMLQVELTGGGWLNNKVVYLQAVTIKLCLLMKTSSSNNCADQEINFSGNCELHAVCVRSVYQSDTVQACNRTFHTVTCFYTCQSHQSHQRQKATSLPTSDAQQCVTHICSTISTTWHLCSQ